MKNVAATSGHSVNLAMDFLAVGNTRDGYWAGSDKELNSYSRPPQRSSLSRCGETSSQSQNTRVLPACKRKMRSNETFLSLVARPHVRFGSLAVVQAQSISQSLHPTVYRQTHARLARLFEAVTSL